jgi:hypothetical protein
VVGCYLQSEDEKLFTEVSLRIRNAEEFAASSLFELKRFRDAAGREQCSLNYHEPEETEMRLGEFKLQLAWVVGRKVEGMFTQRLQAEAWFKISSDVPKALDELFEGPVWSLSTFLQLAANCYLPLVCVRARSPLICEDGYPLSLEIVTHQSMRLPLNEPLYRPELLFTLDDIHTKPDVLTRWQQFREKHKSTFDTFFMGLRFDNDFTLEHQFLDHVYALESYHRRSSGSRKLDLNSRFLQLCRRLPKEAELSIGDVASFCGDVVLTRNYYAHQDDEKADKALKELLLYLCILRLGLLLRCVILQDIGFDEAQIVCAMKKTRLPQHIDDVSKQISSLR